MSRRPRVLVTDAGRGSAIAVIRSLGRRGFDVVAADEDPLSPGLWSRYTVERLRYPSPRSAPHAAVDALLDRVRKGRIDLVVPVTDEIILPLAGRRREFEDLCTLALAGQVALEAAWDKLATLELAKQVAVPVPRTAVVRTPAEALRVAGGLGWPVVLKPRVSRGLEHGRIEAFGVSYAGDRQGLWRAMEPYEGRCDVLLQEHYPGVGYGVEILAHRGRVLAAFQHRRLREVPITGGASAFRESVALDPELYRHAAALLRGLEWTGLAMAEFRVGARGPVLMEVNGRIWGSLPLAVAAGMDFPARLAELLLTGPPPDGPPHTAYRVGVRSRNLELDVVWIAAVLGGKSRYPFLQTPSRVHGLGPALRLLDPGTEDDILSVSDPLPGLLELAKLARKIPRKLSGRR